MAINIADSFNRTTAQPPFAGIIFADLTARDAYATTLRYEGMECYVISESLYYSLVGGTDNANWIERKGGSGSGVVVVADITERNSIPEEDRTNGMLVQVIAEDTIYKLIGLPAGATTTDANWDPVITGKAAQVITNKDIDFGTASNTSRLTLPKAAKAALDALVRKEGAVYLATDEGVLYYDTGTTLVPLGAASGSPRLASRTFNANGPYKVNTFIDGAFVIPFAAKITGADFFSLPVLTGSLGDHIQYDIKKKEPSDPDFVTIFSTLPRLNAGAPYCAAFGLGYEVPDHVHIIPPVLSNAAYVYPMHTIFRFDIVTLQMPVSPYDFTAKLTFEEVI